MTTTQTESDPECIGNDGGHANHVFMGDLFREAKEPDPLPPTDMSMDDRPDGLGLIGERFDLACPDCNGTFLRLKKSTHGLFYGCPNWPECVGTHGAHTDGSPKGIPGNKNTRLARIEAHRVFDQLFTGPKRQMTEPAAYAWMAQEMKLSPAEAHIARFDIEQCRKVIQLTNLRLGPSAWDALVGEDPFDASEIVVAERDPQKPQSILDCWPADLVPDSPVKYTLRAFIHACKRSELTDYDGVGYLGTFIERANPLRTVKCSGMARLGSDYQVSPFTHVWWYTK